MVERSSALISGKIVKLLRNEWMDMGPRFEPRRVCFFLSRSFLGWISQLLTWKKQQKRMEGQVREDGDDNNGKKTDSQ